MPRREAARTAADTWLVLPAAGRGERLGATVPKAMIRLGSSPLLVHSLVAAAECGEVDAAVVVADPEVVRPALAKLDRRMRGFVRAVVAGGPTRRDSVRNGLAAVREAVGAEADPVVLVHDAARPFAPPELFALVAVAVRSGYGAVIPARPSADAVKQVADERVQASVPRESLALVQTPQGARLALLERAHREWGGGEAADDAMLVEALGEPVRVIPGSSFNVKITTQEDLDFAEAWVRSGGMPWMKKRRGAPRSRASA